MGSIITLSVEDQQVFRRGLNLLRQDLNNPEKFAKLVARGLKEIFVVSGLWQTKKYGRLFDYPYFSQWANEDGEEYQERYYYAPSEMDTETVRRELELLRNVLNDDALRAELAAVGPCVLTLCCPGDYRCDGPGALVSNFIPGLMPNADWSVYQSGHTLFHG